MSGFPGNRLSFFLYLKQEALGAFYLHLLETPEQETFYEVVHRLEIGMSRAFEEAEVQTASLYRTHLRALFAYPELIAQGGGFIKRKLLQRRFNFMEKVHFIRHGAYNALNADYHKMVTDAGLAPDFKKEWLPKLVCRVLPSIGTLHVSFLMFEPRTIR